MNYELVRQLFDYLPSGHLVWKRSQKGVVEGMKAGWARPDGYIVIKISQKPYLAHRLVFLWHHGYLPEHGIDHIDRNPGNNNITNLREATQSCNMRNCGLPSNNTTGVKGVNFHSQTRKWRAEVKAEGSNHYLGVYAEFLDAVKARWAAEVKFNFPNCCSDSTAYLYIKEHDPQFLQVEQLA